jgi:hypothetical protein
MNTMKLPTLEILRPNFTALYLYKEDGSTLKLWFSYQTCVAFSQDGSTPTVRENEWGPTTGKHLNAIRRDERVTGERFARLLAERLA